MSYNISSWKTKKLNNLVIPLKYFYESERKDWHPSEPTIVNTDGDIKLECGCEQTIIGSLKNEMLTIKEFEMYGEGSGTFFYYILENALKQSTGELEAIIIWEGGDSITKLIVKDGNLIHEELEL